MTKDFWLEFFSLWSRAYNVFFLGGVADMTTSARAHIEPLPRHRAVINFFFRNVPISALRDEDHCKWAYDFDVERAHQLIDGTLLDRDDDAERERAAGPHGGSS